MIETAGERAAEELIRNLTVAGANGVPTSNTATGFTPGASSISLRGFDPSDTLTLVNGRRVASYPLGANGTESFVDLNSIPRAAIESIEILKDGASTTYGADAVAGVVNIKLRRDYRGAETQVEYGNTFDRDSGEVAASLIYGVGNDETSFTGVLNYYRRNSIFNRDRSYSAVTRAPSSSTSPILLQLDRAPVLAAGGHPPPDLGDTFFGRAPFLTTGLAPAASYSYLPGIVRDFNFNAFSESLPDTERYGGLAQVEHKVFGEQLELYAELFYQNVLTQHEVAPSATGAFLTPGQITLAIPPHASGAVLGGPTYGETGVPIGAYNPFNPFQQIISGSTRARLLEFGDRRFNFETDAFLSTIGLKGDKLFGGSWGYDSAFRYSQIKNTFTGTFASASRFDRILNAADPIFDPASSQYIGTTIPYNPFGDYRVPIPKNNLPVAFATVHPTEEDLSKLATLDVNIYTTSLVEIPGGGVGLALGAQFRREQAKQEPDSLLLAGDIIGSGAATPTSASRNIYAFYA
ncbi:MAG: TonB-dependent receptor plug domain-containing protein [Chthoniobacterales bacterium]|nr:TonB-dependent receptor plug domain-containing protein [Chthoniobacterales bacterium]